MEAEGIHRPRQLLRKAGSPDGKFELRQVLRKDERQFQLLLDEAELYTFKGIGHRFGALLKSVGVQRVHDLSGFDPEILHAGLVTSAARYGVHAPRLDMVRVWVLASQDKGIVMNGREFDSES